MGRRGQIQTSAEQRPKVRAIKLEIETIFFIVVCLNCVRYQRLLKNRALDPLSQRKLSSVQSKFMYLEQQLNEVNQALDIEWKEHLRITKGHVNERKKIEDIL